MAVEVAGGCCGFVCLLFWGFLVFVGFFVVGLLVLLFLWVLFV